ncbi:MAG: urease subunit gamma, partial [Candidatus Nitrosopolaris sp.]
NYPESVAYIANHVVEGAREGKTVAGLMKSAREILKRAVGRSGGSGRSGQTRSGLNDGFNATCHASQPGYPRGQPIELIWH